MSKRALSVTLTPDNILFLRARAHASGARSVSEVLDALITAARSNGVAAVEASSIVGLASISDEDPDLVDADRAVREVFSRSTALLSATTRAPGSRGRRAGARARSARA